MNPIADRKKVIIIALIALILVIGAAVLLIKGAGNTDPGDNTTNPVQAEKLIVPDFCTAGYTESEVKNQALWMAQFNITFEYDYSMDVEENIIFKQSVDSGSEVERGSAIVLTVSKGIETVKIPDVGGLNRQAAVEKLEAEGFKVRVVYIYNDNNNAPNTVKSKGGIAPKEGSVVAKGDEVIIQVYGDVVTTEPETEPTTTPESNPNQ